MTHRYTVVLLAMLVWRLVAPGQETVAHGRPVMLAASEPRTPAIGADSAVTRNQPQAARIAVATPDVTVPPDAMVYDRGPVTCNVTPRTADNIATLSNIIVATPTLYSDPDGRSARRQAGSGVPADPQTVADILAVEAQLSVCFALHDIPRFLALYSDPLAALVVARVPANILDATPLPTDDLATAREPLPFSLWQIERFPDGRVGAYHDDGGGVTYATFVRGADYQWLVDAIEFVGVRSDAARA